MIELRWLCRENAGRRQLEYRVAMPCVDASGSLTPAEKWSEWKPVLDGIAFKRGDKK